MIIYLKVLSVLLNLIDFILVSMAFDTQGAVCVLNSLCTLWGNWEQSYLIKKK